MAKQLTDEELTLRRKLRRRLIGAAALMLAVVVLLPMVLDSEPKATGEDIDLRIPAADKVGEFVPGKATEELVELPASAVSVGSSAVASAVEEAVQIAPVVLPSSQGLITQAPSVKAPLVPAVSTPAAVQPAHKTAEKIAVKTPEKVAVKPPEKITTKTPEKASPATHPDAHKPSSDKADTGFVAQVGAYSNAETAKHELAQLKGWGFKAYTEKSGDKIRVRVGPYAERDKAEKVRHLLEKHGLHPVVTPTK